MSLDASGLYAAFKAKDARFDGRFFVGISSTGIYCRPVCRAKQPKAENCTFFTTAAEAERHGYRPCLLCRPELAPGASITDATADLAYRAARLLESDYANGTSLENLAGRLGCSDRHLRRVFADEYHVTPVQYLQTCRLLAAKQLLTDTSLSVIQVAMASGFGSVRRFNDVFRHHYHMSPTDLRKSSGKTKTISSHLRLSLGYRPPYLWEPMRDFLAGRAIAGIDLVNDGEYCRTVALATTDGDTVSGWVRVGHNPQRTVLDVTLSDSLLPVVPQVLARVRHLFDLYCDPDTVYETLTRMNAVKPDLCRLGTRLPGCFDSFEMAVRAILGQQISVKAASTLAGRIVKAYGTPVETGMDGLTHIFPTPEMVVAMGDHIQNRFGELGVTSARSRTIGELARQLVAGEIHLDLCKRPEEEMHKLLAIPGIGPWTAQYIAMRAMEWPDAFLQTDVGIRKALAPHGPKELLEMAEAWRPWRSYATINLWNSL
ncbi:MAG: helix-turn-helix domain-containing protein [Planctomycetaceae bacterium]|nr:helix-turn-helix domain-containing protein [Planctomycetaceae bacterium]